MILHKITLNQELSLICNTLCTFFMSLKRRRTNKYSHIWVHNSSESPHEIIINPNVFVDQKVGDILQISKHGDHKKLVLKNQSPEHTEEYVSVQWTPLSRYQIYPNPGLTNLLRTTILVEKKSHQDCGTINWNSRIKLFALELSSEMSARNWF